MVDMNEGLNFKSKHHSMQYTQSETKKNELSKIKRLKEKFLSPEELENLFKMSEVSIRDHAIILTAYYYALRISEVGMLQLEDFKDRETRIFIRRLKNGVSNFFTLNEEVKKAVRKWLVLRGNNPGALFPGRKSLKFVTDDKGQVTKIMTGLAKRQLDNLFKKYAQKAGLPENHWNFHTLRHTCAVNMVDIDIPMKQIQDWLGHTSIQSTLIYANVSSAKREETADRFFKIRQKEVRGTGIDWSKDKKAKKIKVRIEVEENKGNK